MAKEVAGLIKLQIKGGDGFAAPPLICNLISPATSLAILFLIFIY